MKQTIMPTYEQLAVWLAKSEQEKEKLRKTIERLKKRPVKPNFPVDRIITDNTGWYALAIILTIFIVAVGMFIINEKYGLW